MNSLSVNKVLLSGVHKGVNLTTGSVLGVWVNDQIESYHYGISIVGKELAFCSHQRNPHR